MPSKKWEFHREMGIRDQITGNQDPTLGDTHPPRVRSREDNGCLLCYIYVGGVAIGSLSLSIKVIRLQCTAVSG